MPNKTILILGGYGSTGRVLARLLLQETTVSIIIAGRQVEKAQYLANKLNMDFPGLRASFRHADAADAGSLADAFQGVDMVIVAATVPQHAKQVAQTCLAAGSDYLDILVQASVVADLRTLSGAIQQAGRIFITQGGFHPGMCAVVIRQAAACFDQYHKAIVSLAMNMRIENSESVVEIIHEVGESNAMIYKNGQWLKATWKDMVKTNFGPPFGARYCYPLQIEEIRPMPSQFGLSDTGVYVAGFNWFVDNLVFPLIISFHAIHKGMGMPFLTKLFTWGLNTFSPPYQGAVILLEAEGCKDGKSRKVRISVKHEDGYLLTAAPVVACLFQYLDGNLNLPGLHLMGNVVDNQRLMNDIKKMGIYIGEEIFYA